MNRYRKFFMALTPLVASAAAFFGYTVPEISPEVLAAGATIGGAVLVALVPNEGV